MGKHTPVIRSPDLLREAYGRPIDKARIGAVKEFPGFGLEAVVDGKQLEIGNSKFMNQQGYFINGWLISEQQFT